MINDYENKQKELNLKQEKFQEIDQQLIQTEQIYQEKQDLLKNIEEEYSIIDKRFRQNQLELNNINSQMQTTQTRDRTLNFLLGQKIQGFHQRLGSLGKRFHTRDRTLISCLFILANIDSKYDVAISTAAGGYLDYYVVDDVKSGECAKNLLKEHKQGTGSFICMDKMLRHAQQANRRFDVPQLAPNTHRLFDLIDINDSIYKNTFYYVLRDTLVVDNIDDAQKVAFGSQTRYRVVTLKGEIIEQSGTMSGGGSFQAHGKMTLTTAGNRTSSRQSINIDPEKRNRLEKCVKEVRLIRFSLICK
jgi:structural maintenance of chromosome 4